MIIKKCPFCNGDLNKEYYGHQRFYEILAKAAETHSKKNYQYATVSDPLSNFKRCGEMVAPLFKDTIKNKPLAICLAYMSKQIDGVFQMIGLGKTNTVEEVRDKLNDILVYAGIAMILEEECGQA